MTTIVYKADPKRGAVWATLIERLAPDLDFRLWPDVGDESKVEYLVAWVPPEGMNIRFPNLKAVFSTGAGVDQFDMSLIPEHIPLVRMIESGIIDGMVEYVTMATLALHRDLPAYLAAQQVQRWDPIAVKPARKTRIGVLGLGVLGQAVLHRLQQFGFTCKGWSRSGRPVEGVQTYGGPDGLDMMLAQTDVLICLLPLTPATHGFLNQALFARLPQGAHLIQVGRGDHLVEDDLIEALDVGQLGHVIMDVTSQEPLPPAHSFWKRPDIWITPHIASMTQPETAVTSFINNIRRLQNGETPEGQVNRSMGY